MVEENKISLNFHFFKTIYCDKLYFFPLNNREKDLERSGIQNIIDLLSNKYDHIEHSISTSLKHKKVYSLIKKLSSNQRDPKKKDDNNIENALVETSLLKEEIKKIDQFFLEECQLEDILSDLHKLGVIIFFEQKLLSDFVIADPHWFNSLIKQILDCGKNRIKSVLSLILQKINEHQLLENFSFSNQKNNPKKSIENLLRWLEEGEKINSPSFFQFFTPSPPKSSKMIEKISFHTLLKHFHHIQNEIEENKLQFIIQQVNLSSGLKSHDDITQLFYTINQTQFFVLLKKILRQTNLSPNHLQSFLLKKNFTINFLHKFDFVFPKDRSTFKDEEFSINQKYLVKLFFQYFFDLFTPQTV